MAVAPAAYVRGAEATCRWELGRASDNARVIGTIASIERRRWIIECGFAPDEEEAAREACEKVTLGFTKSSRAVEPEPIEIRTDDFRLQVPDGYLQAEEELLAQVKPKHATRAVAGIYRIASFRWIGIFPTGFEGAATPETCAPLADEHARLDGAKERTLDTFSHPAGSTCRWEYRVGDRVAVTTIGTGATRKWLIVCAFAASDEAFRETCDEVTVGFTATN